MSASAESYVAIRASLILTDEQYRTVFQDLANIALENKPDSEGPWDLEVKARWVDAEHWATFDTPGEA